MFVPVAVLFVVVVAVHFALVPVVVTLVVVVPVVVWFVIVIAIVARYMAVVAVIRDRSTDDGQGSNTRDDFGGIVAGLCGRRGKAGKRDRNRGQGGREAFYQHENFLSKQAKRACDRQHCQSVMYKRMAMAPASGNNASLLSDNMVTKAVCRG